MSAFTPTITTKNIGDNTFVITVATAMNLEDDSKISLFTIKNNQTGTYLCNKTDMSTVFDTYNGISEEGLSLTIQTRSKNNKNEQSGIVSYVF